MLSGMNEWDLAEEVRLWGTGDGGRGKGRSYRTVSKCSSYKDAAALHTPPCIGPLSRALRQKLLIAIRRECPATVLSEVHTQ